MVRWMAHWVAELMERVEGAETLEAREEAQRTCAEAILTLWSRRQHWPYGAPLQRVASALDGLAGPPEHHEDDRPDPSEGWGGAMSAIDRLGEEEWDIVRQAAVAELDLETEKAVLNESPDAPPDGSEDDERRILKRLIEMQERQQGKYFKLGAMKAPGFGDLSPDERAEKIQEALTDVDRRRAEVLKKAAATSPPAFTDGESADD